MAVKARNSVEIENSCNGPCCCFGKKKKHRKASSTDSKVATVVSTAQLQIVNPEPAKDVTWRAMPINPERL